MAFAQTMGSHGPLQQFNIPLNYENFGALNVGWSMNGWYRTVTDMTGTHSLEVKAKLLAPEPLGINMTQKATMFLGHKIQNASEEFTC